METTQLMYKTMFKAVIKVSNDNPTIIATNPGYVAGLGRLVTIVSKIEKAEGKQGTVITGVTKDRKTMFNELCSAHFIVTSGAAGYADSIHSDTLYNQFNKSITQIQAFQFAGIKTATDQLILDINPYLTILATDWGITTTVLENLATKLSDYNEDFEKPRQAVVARNTQTDTILPPLYTEGRKILKRAMDKGAIILSTANTEWYGQYKGSRELITIHHNITTVKGNVIDSITKAGIPYPHISSPEEHISTIGDLNGSYVLTFIPGDSTLLIEATAYKSKTIPVFHIKPGETLHFDVELDPQ